MYSKGSIPYVMTPILISNLNKKQQLNMGKLSNNFTILFSNQTLHDETPQSLYNTIPYVDDDFRSAQYSIIHNQIIEEEQFCLQAPTQTCIQNLISIFKSIANTICVFVLPESSSKSFKRKSKPL